MSRSSGELQQVAQECRRNAAAVAKVQSAVQRLGGAIEHEIGGTATGEDKKMLALAGAANSKLRAAVAAFQQAQQAAMRAAQEAAKREAEERRQRAQQAARH